MPQASLLRSAADRTASLNSAKTEAFDIPLFLPSSLPSRVQVSKLLYEYEFRLRRAQAYEALEELRGHLRLRTHMWQYKDKNIRGQSANTRSNNLINNVQIRANTSATKYRAAHAALHVLSKHTGDVGWDTSLQELADTDIRAFTDDTDGETQAEKRRREKKNKGKKGLGEGRKKLSWIWMVVGVAEDGEDKGLQEGAFVIRYVLCAAKLTTI